MAMSEASEDDYYTNGFKSLKEISRANSSSRIYYYGNASVPFVWETRPGTPKKDSLFSESFRVPPLTPPPSYYSSSESNKSKARTKQNRFVKTLFNGKRHVSRPSFSWSSTTTSSSSSSSSFSSSSPPRSKARKCYLSCSRSLVKEEDHEVNGSSSSSPRSTLCCRRGFSSSMGSMKRALCSVLSFNGSSRKDLRLI